MKLYRESIEIAVYKSINQDPLFPEFFLDGNSSVPKSQYALSAKNDLIACDASEAHALGKETHVHGISCLEPVFSTSRKTPLAEDNTILITKLNPPKTEEKSEAPLCFVEITEKPPAVFEEQEDPAVQHA